MSRLSELEKPWQMALTLAWEAHVRGNVGVGAVLTDRRGRVVAVGRNRVCDRKAPPGRLRSTAIAHAELDILGQLVPGDYKNHTLWTTLESCALCSIAVVTSNVGRVEFAARAGSGTGSPGPQSSTNSSRAAGLSGADPSAAPFPCSPNCSRCSGSSSTSRLEPSFKNTKARIRDCSRSPGVFAPTHNSPD